jgi:hypothetical protein
MSRAVFGNRRRMRSDEIELLRALLASWEYAFAMGHGCSIGDDAEARDVRRRAADPRARIAELSD